MADRKAALAKYHASPKGKATRERYRSQAEVKAKMAAAARLRKQRRLALESPEEKALRLALRRAEQARVKADPARLARQQAALKRNYERRKELGICVACNALAIAGLRCMMHWFECVGRNYGLTLANGGAETLRELWESQQGRCALTGERMIPGTRHWNGASVDHILPQSRGGTSARSNLQWVTRRANAAKNDLTLDEFVDLCRAVTDARAGHAANVVALKKQGAS
jgi:hypothetical protein